MTASHAAFDGYIDLQVNGYAGVDFNQPDLRGDDFHRACELMAAHGVREFLPTVITEDLDRMCATIRQIVRLRESDTLIKSMTPGLHVEGPFLLNQDGYRGAHVSRALRSADIDDAKRLLDASAGLLRILTLAPECDPNMRVTSWLSAQGVVVSAGHTDANLEILHAAIDAGLQMFTHFGNGTPGMLPRHDNILHRVLSLADRLWICVIADGVHVPFVALQNYVRLIGVQRLIGVTDAMTAAGLGPGRYRFASWDLVVGEDLVARSPDGSHLMGAVVTMPAMHHNLRHGLGLAESECKALLSDNPSRAISSRFPH